MRARDLQRVIVRMLHDPALRARVFAGDPRLLETEGLGASELAMLRRTDPRAWAIDAHRPWRVLTALLNEVLVTAAALGAPERFQAFFASDAFHRAVMARQSLFSAFPAWLATTYATSPNVLAVLTLERAFIAVRRACDDLYTERMVALALPVGTLAAWELAAKALGNDPVKRIVAGQRIVIGRLGPGTEHVLVERPRGQAEPVAGYIPAELAALLGYAAAAPRTRAELVAFVATTGGMASGEAEEVVAELEADGLVGPLRP